MTLDELLPRLKGYRSVLVTGPQRSGTTIAARIISAEMGLRYVDELDVGVHDEGRVRAALAESGIVLQAPGMAHLCDTFGPDVAVVFMRRHLDEIRRSEDRIEWRTRADGQDLKLEQAKYAARFGVRCNNMALLKYTLWEGEQQERCGGFDLDYASLAGHPLWKDREARAGFGDRQWK